MTNKNLPPIKFSEAILRIAEPLIKKHPKRERITVLIVLTVFAWNASMMSEADRNEAQKKLANLLPNQLDGTESASILDLVEFLMERKRSLYSDVNHVIVSHSLSFEDNGSINLEVGTVER